MRTTVSFVQKAFAGISVSATKTPALKRSSNQFLTSTSLRIPALSRPLSTTAGVFGQADFHTSHSYNHPIRLQARNFAKKTKGKSGDSSSSAGSAPPAGEMKASVQQHQEWIDFQKSIAVDGFETGQTTTVKKSSRRGGKRLSQRKSKEAVRLEERLAERQRLTDIGGGEYPPLRYSDADTERLLAQAYAAIPERAGRRGTRNKKRQFRRWRLVRQIRKKYKKNMMKYQERKMTERSRRVKSVKVVLTEAPDIRNKDREYQLHVFQRWMANMYPDKVAAAEETKKSLSP